MKMVAGAAAPGRASFDVTVLVVLVSRPSAVLVAVTLTAKVQLTPGPSEAPTPGFPRLMLLLPATAVIVPASQTPVMTLGEATTSPAGSGSVKVRPVSVRTL